MGRRTTSRSVVFRRPFILTGFDAVWSAGTYVVDVDEEEIDNLSFLAYQRVSTRIQLPSLGRTEHHFIDPVELDEALLRDAAQEEPVLAPSATHKVARSVAVSRPTSRR